MDAPVKKYSLCVGIACLLLMAGPASGAAIGTNYDLIVLTPGHSRAITYQLHNTIVNDPTAYHATLIVTAGTRTDGSPAMLTVMANKSSFIGDNAEIVFATAGLVGVAPVLAYSYGSSSIVVNVQNMPAVGVGLLLTGIVSGFNGPKFPVTMSMTFSLQ